MRVWVRVGGENEGEGGGEGEGEDEGESAPPPVVVEAKVVGCEERRYR